MNGNDGRPGVGSGPAPSGTGTGCGRLPPSRHYRDLFPLPRVHPPPMLQRGGRRSRQRRSRIRALAAGVDEIVRSLNWMHSPLAQKTIEWDYRPEVWPTLGMQGDVLARLDGLVRDQQPSREAPSPQAAFEKLLRGADPYDLKGGSVSLAPFRLDRLSLPGSVRDCPQLSEILPSDALEYLKGYHERMLNTCESDTEVQEFMDPLIARNQKIPYTSEASPRDRSCGVH